jgi:hypothetical protein
MLVACGYRWPHLCARLPGFVRGRLSTCQGSVGGLAYAFGPRPRSLSAGFNCPGWGEAVVFADWFSLDCHDIRAGVFGGLFRRGVGVGPGLASLLPRCQRLVRTGMPGSFGCPVLPVPDGGSLVLFGPCWRALSARFLQPLRLGFEVLPRRRLPPGLFCVVAPLWFS